MAAISSGEVVPSSWMRNALTGPSLAWNGGNSHHSGPTTVADRAAIVSGRPTVSSW
jgi:hypothetical protein